MEVIFVLAVVAILLLIFFGLSWWTSNSKSYRAWEMKEACYAFAFIATGSFTAALLAPALY